MPAINVNLYGAYVWDIGLGDINGDGVVDTDDITLFRQWLVGGYYNNIIAAVPDYNGDILLRVADVNGDGASDIRDVSSIRMAIVGGYGYAILDDSTGSSVTGEEIARVSKYTATFRDYDGTVLGTSTVDYLSSAIAPDDPTRANYTFIGWNRAFNIMVADIDVTAVYAINQHTITFDSNGGTAVTAITEDYGTAISAPQDPTRAGYTFVCWYDGEEIYTFSTMPAGDITLIAEWELINNGLLFTLINDETEYEVARGTNTDDEVVLPAIYNDKPVTRIADQGFIDWTKETSITNISIPDSITIIGDFAFAYTRLTNILLPDSVTHIGMGAFFLADLQDITISEYVVTIGSVPFFFCNNLSNISVDQDNPNYLSENGVLFNKDKTELIVYPPTKLDTSYTVPETVITLGEGAFGHSYNLISVTLSDSLNTISTYAFAYCSNLVSIIIPESVTSIGESAFLQCISLITVNIMRSSTLSVIELLIDHDYGNYPFHGTAGSLVIYVLPDSYASYIASPWNIYTIAPMPTVTFDTDGGTVIDDEVILGNSALTEPEDPSKDGHTFDGWYVEDTFVTPYDFETILTADMTIYAKFTLNQYTITFDSNYGTAVTAITEDYGTAISQPVDPTRAGYTFGGWYDGEEIYTFSTMPARDFTLIAEWEFINNGLLFTLINDETEYEVARGTNTDDEVVLPAIYNDKPVTRIADQGFFSDYKPSSITSISIPDSITIIGDLAFAYTRLTNITLPDSISVIGSFVFWGADLQTISISKYVVTIGNSPFAECLYLSNISVDQDNPNYLSENGVLFNKDKTALIAYPSAKLDTSYTVPETVIILGDGAFNYSHNLISVTLPDSLSTINHFVFANCINLVSIIIPESVTLIGQYAFIESGLLTVNIMRSSTLSVIELLFVHVHHPFHLTSGSLVIYVLPDSYDSYIASPWNILTIAPMPTVTFETDGATAIDDEVILGNSALAEPEDPTKDGHTFVDWYVEDTFVTPYDFDTLLTADMTIYAKFTINQYTATFKDYDGTIIDTSTVDYLTSAVAPTDPERVGYSFSGWDTDYSSMTADIDVTATYTINQYTITFNTNGGTAINPIDVPYNTAVAEPTAPTLAGCFFDGWFSDEAMTISYDFATLVTADATLYARWTDPDYFTYTVNGSDVTITGLNADYPSVINIPSTLEGKNVVAIGNNAFKDKTSIATVTIPSGVTSIGTTVFLNCTSLTSITVASTNPNYSSEGGVLFNKLKTNLIAYPIGNTATSYTVLSSVTAIIDRAFQQADNLIEVILPDNLITIGNSAFYHCDNLLGMDIPITVTSIGASAFEMCIAFKEITFALGISLTTISMSTFRFSGLEQIIIPASVVNIFSNAFSICTSLNSVTFEAGSLLTNIYYDAFIGSSSFTSITLPDSVTTLYEGAFQATGLTSIILPSNITTIPNNLFAYCSSLTSITIGANITSIGELAFCGNSLTEVIFEEGSQLESIGFGAFSSNVFATINLPSSLTTIGEMAFTSCNNLQTIVIPSSVTSIGDSCFSFNNALEYIYLMRKSSDTVTSGGITMVSCSPLITKIYVHADSVAAYKAASGWSDYADYIFAMPSMTFDNNGGSSIDAVIDIPYGTAVAEPAQPTKLGFAFSGWYIDDSFSAEYDFATIVTADTTVYALWTESPPTAGLSYNYYDWQISWSVNIGSATDTDIIIPSTHMGLPVVNIGFWGFYNTNITSVVISEGIKYIEDSAFEICSNLHSVVLPSTLESIGEYAFSSTALTSIIIPDSVTFIGYGAFSNNPLSNVVLGTGLTSIENNTFNGCSMEEITIPYNIQSLGQNAFGGNSNLKTIIIERPSSAGITEMNGSFCCSLNITNIYVPDADSIAAYQVATGWSDYSAIIGMPTVTFDLDGGSGIDTNVDVAYGTAVAQPSNPTKSGFTFDGWYVDDSFSEEYDFATLITADTTIYARWL